MKLSKLVSDGALFQQGKPIHVWGTAEPGEQITAGLFAVGEEAAQNVPASLLPAASDVHAPQGKIAEAPTREATAKAAQDGRFDLYLAPLPAGGPYELLVCGEEGRELRVHDILIGALWYVSGQSNIDVDVERCYDSYPELVRDCTDDGIRSFRVKENADYHGPVEEPVDGFWRKAEYNSILGFSASAYFFARALREMTGVPVGILQASLGGSRITSWLSKKMLEGDDAYLPLLEEAERYGDDAFMQSVVHSNETAPAAWKEDLDQDDAGRKEGWQEHPERILESDTSLEMPCYFRDTALSGFTGCVWFSRSFEVPEEMAGKSAGLWLGTMVDSDITYVNGVKVGETGYQYPPRKYRIPERVLRAGRNTIVVRLVVEGGKGRWTPGKGYFIYNDQGIVDLKGTWSYRIGAKKQTIPPTDFVSWKATGLFNGTAYPCFALPVEGMLWYQGEANTHQPYDYLDLMKRYVTGYRKLWRDETLPFYFVQLPNYDVTMDGDMDWAPLRDKQRLAALEIPHAGMAVAMDLGEDNDLHPHGKKEIGRRLALMAAHDVYGADVECTGPVPVSADASDWEEHRRVAVTLTHAEGLYADSFDKGSVVTDAKLVAADGRVYPAEVILETPGETAHGIAKTSAAYAANETETKGCAMIYFTSREFPAGEKPAQVRYAFCSTMTGALIWNEAGLPMTPFVLNIR